MGVSSGAPPCRQQWEEGKTHDELWNASQLQMVHLGKMHGFMRMYWVRFVYLILLNLILILYILILFTVKRTPRGLLGACPGG